MSLNNQETNDGRRPSSALNDFLQAYRGETSQPPAEDWKIAQETGRHRTWNNSRPLGDGRTAGEWRASWQVQHRPPVKTPRSWKVFWLSLVMVISMAASIYALVVIDKVVRENNPPEASKTEPWIPAIHWGGQ